VKGPAAPTQVVMLQAAQTAAAPVVLAPAPVLPGTGPVVMAPVSTPSFVQQPGTPPVAMQSVVHQPAQQNTPLKCLQQQPISQGLDLLLTINCNNFHPLIFAKLLDILNRLDIMMFFEK